ncbi:hypothetical protein EMCRGX_G008396 [Ephydatia muelleri]
MQIRRQHRSTGCIPERDSPSSSPLALREKEHLAPPGPMHLEPDVELSLQELVTRHHEMLPLQVRVCKKKVQEEAADQVSLAVGGVYNLHFTVRKKIAAFTSSSGETFSLPAYSNAKCALVYNPERDAGRAFAGYTFRDVADLAKAQPTPVVVCATQPGESGEVESAIVAGEILALKSVDAGREGRIRVRAYSFKTESVKMLEDGCNAGFTTRPSEVQLPLQRIVKELSPMLPCCVHMFGAEGEREHSATLRLLSLQVVEWTLLVATSPQTIHEVLEVSITPDTEVKVKMVEVGGRDLLEIKSRTCLLQSKYHLTEKGRSVSETSLGSDKTYPRPDVSRGPQTQLDDSLYELPCNAHAQAMVGTLRAKSLPVSEEFPSGTGSSLKKNIAQIAPLPSPSMTSNGAVFRFPETGTHDEAVPYETQCVDSAVRSLRAKCQELQHGLSLCKEFLKEQQKEIAAAHRSIANLQKEVEELKRQSIQGERSPLARQENVSLLTALNITQVLKLLEGLGLSQYKSKFNNERVSGKILAQCNEKILEKNLGVSSKLHRMRLMEFIEGSECVHTVISKQ